LHPSWFEWTSLGQCVPPDDPTAPDEQIEEEANDAPKRIGTGHL